jgi:hypothetical protein
VAPAPYRSSDSMRMALPRITLSTTSWGTARHQLLRHLLGVGPRGVGVRVIGLEGHVVGAHDVDGVDAVPVAEEAAEDLAVVVGRRRPRGVCGRRQCSRRPSSRPSSGHRRRRPARSLCRPRASCPRCRALDPRAAVAQSLGQPLPPDVSGLDHVVVDADDLGDNPARPVCYRGSTLVRGLPARPLCSWLLVSALTCRPLVALVFLDHAAKLHDDQALQCLAAFGGYSLNRRVQLLGQLDV